MPGSVFDAAGVPDPRKPKRRSVFDVANEAPAGEQYGPPVSLAPDRAADEFDAAQGTLGRMGETLTRQAAEREVDRGIMAAEADAETVKRGRDLYVASGRSGEEWDRMAREEGPAFVARADEFLRNVEGIHRQAAAGESTQARIRHYAGMFLKGATAGLIDPAKFGAEHDPRALNLPGLNTVEAVRRDMGMGERLLTGAGELAGAGLTMGGASKALQAAGAGPRLASTAGAAAYGAASNPEAPVEGALTMAALVRLGAALEGRMAEVLPKLPMRLRPIAASGGGNALAGALLGQTSPDEVVSNLVLGVVSRAVDAQPDITEADLRRQVMAEVQQRRAVNARVRDDVTRRTAEIDARNETERALRRDAPKAGLPAGEVRTRPALPSGQGETIIRVDAEGRSLAGAADLPAGEPAQRTQALPQGAIQAPAGPEPKSWRRAVEAFQRAPGGVLAARLFARGQFIGQNMADLRNTAALVGVDTAGAKSKAELVDRLVKAAESRRPPTLSLEQAGEVKRRAVDAGLATVDQVASRERLEVAEAARAGGATPEQVARLVQSLPSEARPDGTIAAGYVPSGQALEQGLIEPAAVPAVEAARARGIEPVTSGTTPLGDGFAVGVDSAGNLRRVEAQAPKSRAAERGQEALDRGEPPDIWIAGVASKLEREGFKGNPVREAVRLWNEQGRLEAEHARQSTSRGTPPLPPSAAVEPQAPGRSPAEAQALDEALKRYGPEKPGPKGGTRLGAGLGGADPATLLKAVDLPRDVLSLPGNILNKPIAKGLDMLGALVGRAASRVPGVKQAAEWWRVARKTQDVFATDAAGREAGALRAEGVLKNVAGKVKGADAQAVAYDYITNPNAPAARERALSTLGGDAVKAIDDALDIRDRNQRYIEQNALVGQEARRVYGAKDGERGTYLRTDYTSVEDEVYGHLLRLGGRGAKLPKNELKHDRWIVTWGKDSYRKFDTEAEAVAFRKSLRAEAREQVEAKKDQSLRGQPVGREPGTNAEIIPPLSPEARKAMGEVTDPAVILARTLALQDLKITRHQTLLALRADSLPGDTPLERIPARFLTRKSAALGKREPARIPDDPRYGPLAGRIVDRHVYAEAVGRWGEIEGIDKVFDISEKLVSLWKAGKTVYNPGSQAGNAFGNIAFTELANVSAARPSDLPILRNALRIALAKPGTPEHALLVEFTRRGFGASASIDTELAGSLRAATEARSGGDKTFAVRLGRILARAPRKSWAMVDAVPKIAAALKVLKKGGTLDDATKVVRESFPDYGRSWAGLVVNSRTRAARAFKAIMSPPFVQFTSEAARIGAHAVKHKAASIGTGLLVLTMLGKLSRRLAGISDEEAEKAMALAPDWMRAGSLAAPFWFDRDDKGNVQIVDLRYILPASETIGDVFGKDDAKRSGWSIINNPILAPLVDIGLNTDRFFGERLSKPGNSEDEEREQKARYLFDAYMPSVLTKVTGLGRRIGSTYKALTGTKDRYGQTPEVPTALMGDFLGVRVRPIDPTVERQRRETSIVARVSQAKSALRDAARKGDEDEVGRIVKLLEGLEAEYEALERLPR